MSDQNARIECHNVEQKRPSEVQAFISDTCQLTLVKDSTNMHPSIKILHHAILVDSFKYFITVQDLKPYWQSIVLYHYISQTCPRFFYHCVHCHPESTLTATAHDVVIRNDIMITDCISPRPHPPAGRLQPAHQPLRLCRLGNQQHQDQGYGVPPGQDPHLLV